MRGPQRLTVSAACVAIAVLASAGGCRREAGAARGAQPGELVVFYTCATEGHIHPCDCEGGAEGGIARRATYLERNGGERTILVDAGNVTAGAREWELLEFEYLLKGYRLMGYDAVNLGHHEAGLSIAQLKEAREGFPRLVSANLVDAKGECVVDPYRVVTLPDGHRVGIIGVMDDTLPPHAIGEGLSVVPPDSAIGCYLPELTRQSDTVVLLAFADEGALIDLANLFYEIPVIVGGRVRQPSAEPVPVNEAVIVYITDKGKSIGRLDLEAGDSGWVVSSNAITELTGDVPDLAAAAAILAEYGQELTNRNYRARADVRDDVEGLRAIKVGRTDEEGD